MVKLSSVSSRIIHIIWRGSLWSKFYKGILPLPLVVSMAVSGEPVHAAVSPSLGAAATYAVLSSTLTNTTAGTTISGDIGFTTGPAVTPGGLHAYYGSVGPYAIAGDNQNTALSSLTSQPCTFSFPAGAVNLSTETTHGPVGVYTPGVYCSSGAMNIGGPLLLNGNGTYIFRSGGALTSTAGAIITLIGASSCDVFWTPTQAVTLAANTTFAGTVIDNAGITVGANSTWNGRALAFGGTVTVDTVTMTLCSAVASSSTSSSTGSLSSSFSSSNVSSSSSSRSSLSSSTSSVALSSSAISSSASSVRRRFSPATISPPVVPPTVPVMPQTGIEIGAPIIAMFGLLLAVVSLFAIRLTKRPW